ncbi:MAG: permease prefix domain 1-containing protein [Longimicrobiales bacterium]
MVPGLLAGMRSLWRGLRRRSDVEADMDDEFRLHVDLRAQDIVRSGLSSAEAKRRARREFGSPERYKQEARMSRGLRRIDAVRFSWLDVRYAVRSLRKKPCPVAMAVLSLGVGIGASTTVFGVIDALDFRPLPYREPDRLVWLTEVSSVRAPGCVGCPDYASAATASEWQSQLTSYERLAAQSHFGLYLDDGDGLLAGLALGVAGAHDEHGAVAHGPEDCSVRAGDERRRVQVRLARSGRGTPSGLVACVGRRAARRDWVGRRRRRGSPCRRREAVGRYSPKWPDPEGHR